MKTRTDTARQRAIRLLAAAGEERRIAHQRDLLRHELVAELQRNGMRPTRGLQPVVATNAPHDRAVAGVEDRIDPGTLPGMREDQS